MKDLVVRKFLVLLLVFLSVTVNNSSGNLEERHKRAWGFGPKPENASCLFPCPEGWCYNGGTCSINDYDCSFICTCAVGFTGGKCNVSITTGPNTPTYSEHTTNPTVQQTTLRDSNIRTCLPGFVCQHGYCSGNGLIKCLCDEGWTGTFCESKLQNKCNLECDEGTVCRYVVDKFECVNILSYNSTESPVVTKVSTVTRIITTTVGTVETTTLRELSLRECMPQFICKHGYCTVKGVPQCTCDTGWKGPFCEVADCSPECDDNYECVVISGTPQCVRKSITPSTTTISTLPSTDHQTPHPVESTTLRDLAERTCLSGLVCEHGYCERSPMFRCVCDPGWKGPFCSETACSPSCNNDQACKIVSGKPVCLAKDTVTSSTTSTTLPTTSLAITTEAEDECESKFNYTLRPYKERFCVPGMDCMYGYCNKSEYSRSSGSGIKLNCVCDEGAWGPRCEYKCCLNCSSHGECYVHHDKDSLNYTQVCLCEHMYNYRYTGKFCQFRVSTLSEPKGPIWWLYVVVVCVIILAILVLMVVVIPYWMWRNRVTVVMKIVHFFQPYEDDDDRIWDAFISYKSSERDERFVLRELYPKLEKELGFKLCMHQRDFIPGETIANNIINAVNNSRRTILVLTPRYVESEFTRFEYQMAQQEMLKKKHRIIPVLLEDISNLKESMDPNLKQIIGSVTYLEYPKDIDNEKKTQKFWKRLELSLPKKRSSSEISNSSSSPPLYIDSVDSSKTNSDKIQISVIDTNKTEEKSKSSDITLDVIKVPDDESNFSDDPKQPEPDICLDVLKLSLDQDSKVDPENVTLGFENDKNKNKNNKVPNDMLDVRLNIEKYMSMMEGTSC